MARVHTTHNGDLFELQTQTQHENGGTSDSEPYAEENVRCPTFTYPRDNLKIEFLTQTLTVSSV